jgi:hypothetical protein
MGNRSKAVFSLSWVVENLHDPVCRVIFGTMMGYILSAGSFSDYACLRAFVKDQ